MTKCAARSLREAALRAACEAPAADPHEGVRRLVLQALRQDSRTSPDVTADRRAADETSPDASPRRRPIELAIRHELFEAARFLYAIVETGDCLRAAHSFAHEPALRLDRRSELLAAVDKSGGCPTFSDLGRALRVTRQAAREMVLAAEAAGDVELFTDPDDRRSIQVALTALGRLKLQRRRLPPSDWTFDLLGGVLSESMRTTAHVLGVIRERLRRYEKELS